MHTSGRMHTDVTTQHAGSACAHMCDTWTRDLCVCGVCADRECDPDLCKPCKWSICRERPPGSVDCHNMKLRLRHHKRVAMGLSRVAGWGAFAQVCCPLPSLTLPSRPLPYFTLPYPTLPYPPSPPSLPYPTLPYPTLPSLPSPNLP